MVELGYLFFIVITRYRGDRRPTFTIGSIHDIAIRVCLYINDIIILSLNGSLYDLCLATMIHIAAEKNDTIRNEKRPQQDCGGMFTQVQASVEILSPVPVSGKCSEKDYERLFIRDPEVKAREGKMAYVRPEYHERIMRITRVIGHDRLTLSAYIDHVLTHHFNQCEDAIKSLYARNYNSVF